MPLLLLATLAHAQAFGRFGYGEPANLPGVILSRSGFVAKAPDATAFTFSQPSANWNPAITSQTGQTVLLDRRPQCPEKASYDLYTPGFRLYFPKGFALKLASKANPYLSWNDGSVGDGVPTPSLKWILVSFQENEPPVLISLEGDQARSFSVQGKSQSWILTTDAEFDGWVQVSLPLGTRAFKTTGAASLGAVSQRFGWETAVWLSGQAKLLGRSIEADSNGVTCTWHFDRAGVLVPTPAILAKLGGYPLSVNTRIRQLQAVNEEGPVTVTDEPDLTIYFPIRRVPMGRFLAEGKAQSPPPATVAPLDVASVVELGMSNLAGSCDESTRKLGEDTQAAYLEQANYFAEPATGSQLPFNRAGTGLDTSAAAAFLVQSLTSTRQASSEANSLLTSILWRQDWLTWRLWADNPAIARRTEALAALAAALCPEPERRLDAAMLQAGMAAERGLNVYWKRSGLATTVPPLIEPMEGLRQVLFALDSQVAGVDCSFARAMLSEIRIYGSIPVNLSRQNGVMQITWDSADFKISDFILASAYPLSLQADGNLADLAVRDAFGLTRVQFKRQSPGPCAAKLNAPPFAKPPPTWIDIPQYAEPLH